MALEAGMHLNDKLQLLRRLGTGGMGEVWVARHKTLDAEIAVKVLREHAPNDEARARFCREAQAVAKLASPHMVSVIDFGVCDSDQPFIAMELLKGEDLRAMLERGGPLPLDECSTVIAQTCRALHWAHERGVVHRDIKPANVFVIDHDGEPFVKVLDFGVAKHSGPDLELTQTGVMMGTPYYMSPEQLLDPKAVDRQADLWSTAVVAYACLTGTLPFLADTMAGLSLKIVGRDYAPPTTLRTDLPVAVDQWLARAFAEKLQDRFPNAREMSRAFREAITGEPLADSEPARVAPTSNKAPEAAPPTKLPEPPTLSPLSATKPGESQSRMPPWLLGAAAALALVATAALVVMALRAPEVGTPSDRATQGATAATVERLAPSPEGSDDPKYDVLADYARAATLALARHPKATIRRIALTGKADGRITSAFFVFNTDDPTSCVKVRLLRPEPEVEISACKIKPNLSPPRCSLERVMGAVRLFGDTDITLAYRTGADFQSEWLLIAYRHEHKKFRIADDCDHP